MARIFPCTLGMRVMFLFTTRLSTVSGLSLVYLLYLGFTSLNLIYQVEQSRIEKICEMAAVMQRAIATDDKMADEERQRIARLETENEGLRALLQINRSYGVSLPPPNQGEGEGEEEGRRGDRTPTPTNELEEVKREDEGESESAVTNHVDLGDHTHSASEA